VKQRFAFDESVERAKCIEATVTRIEALVQHPPCSRK
jgi:hypothetical protein